MSVDEVPKDGCKSNSEAEQKKAKKAIVVVPPDMLSECSDVSDAESENSLEVAIDDPSLLNAKRETDKIFRSGIISVAEDAKDLTFADISQKVPKPFAKVEEKESKVEHSENVTGKTIPQNKVSQNELETLNGISESIANIGFSDIKLNPKPAFPQTSGAMVSPIAPDIPYSRPITRAENNLLQHPAFRRPHDKGGKPSGGGGQGPTVEQVMRLTNWEKYVQKTGYVVRIVTPHHTRLAAGSLKPFPDNNRQFALFSPSDSRIPRMKVPLVRCPPNLLRNKREFQRRIYLAKITKWTDHKWALGDLVEDIGVQGNIDAESKAFLLQSGIDITDFKAEAMADLPEVGRDGWSIPEEALEGRRDYRNECIFSVDPATARDLDDALSCTPLEGDMYRVGVHIADVSYFVGHGGALDLAARDRATSVYLVDRVIPMLPRLLCEQLCSLNPSEDRLAFSVEWTLNSRGEVCSTWFGRSVIRPCVKLAYEHAQAVIDQPGVQDQDMPQPTGGHSKQKVVNTIRHLWTLASRMRKRRFRDGALKLDQKKLCFSLNADTKAPEAVHLFEGREANWMIEEFMLLANISVAHKINEVFPQRALLRCHPQPSMGKLQDTARVLESFGVSLDTSSAGNLYHALQSLVDGNKLSEDGLQVVVNMLSKPMATAIYFTPATYHEDFSHYALNVPFYTHFTSPIRRYPDVFVHRLLAAAVDPKRYSLPEVTDDQLDRIVSKANEKKVSAKQAGEHSMELYLAELVKKVGEIKTSGMIIGVLDKALDVYIPEFATIKRSYVDKMDLVEANFDPGSRDKAPKLHVVWKPNHALRKPSSSSAYTYFARVEVMLTPFTNDQLKINCLVLRPEE